MDLFLHDQGVDAISDRYSVQTEEGGVLFLFNPVGMTAREVMAQFCEAPGCNWVNAPTVPASEIGPALCSGGKPVVRDPCEHCGATSYERCRLK